MKNQELKRKMLISALTFLMAFGMTNSIIASSWRIGTSTYKPHFTSISEAMSSENVQDGDTLYLDPSISLSSSTVTKAVTIVGTGSSGSSISGIALSAENCKVLGCWINGDVTMKSPNTTLERCYISGTVDMNNQENAIIRQCRIEITSGSNTDVIKHGINSILENNIIINSWKKSASGSGAAYKGHTISGMLNCIFRNNYIERNYQINTVNYSGDNSGYVLSNFSNCEIINNIILNRSYNDFLSNYTYFKEYTFTSFSNCTLYHNLLSSSENSLYPYNLFSQSYNGLNPTNGQGYATDGSDCGPYGGSNPYVDNCRPFGHPYNVKMNITLPDIDGILKVSSDTRIQNQ